MQPIKTKLKLKGLFQSVDKWKSCTKALNKINKDNLELWTIQSSSSPRAENKHNKSPLMLFLMTIYCLLLWSCSYVPPARPTEAFQLMPKCRLFACHPKLHLIVTVQLFKWCCNLKRKPQASIKKQLLARKYGILIGVKIFSGAITLLLSSTPCQTTWSPNRVSVESWWGLTDVTSSTTDWLQHLLD